MKNGSRNTGKNAGSIKSLQLGGLKCGGAAAGANFDGALRGRLDLASKAVACHMGLLGVGVGEDRIRYAEDSFTRSLSSSKEWQRVIQ